MEICKNEYHTLHRGLALVQVRPELFARHGLAMAGWRGCPTRDEKARDRGGPP